MLSLSEGLDPPEAASLDLAPRLCEPHEHQRRFLDSPAKRKVLRAGRRGGKTTGSGILGVRAFLEGERVLYAAPTEDQITSFWFEVKRALQEYLDAAVFVKNETKHVIEQPGSTQRIRAKTAWNADTLRGDYADLLILDEFQLMAEDAWNTVGAPMLLDNNGDAVFIYTPLPPNKRSSSRARDPRHAAKMFKKADADTSGRWAAFHFASNENPHISKEALTDLSSDMTALAIRQEIGAEDVEEVPGALWSQAMIEANRVASAPEMKRVAIRPNPTARAAPSPFAPRGEASTRPTDPPRYLGGEGRFAHGRKAEQGRTAGPVGGVRARPSGPLFRPEDFGL
jgi:hypothetical protein